MASLLGLVGCSKSGDEPLPEPSVEDVAIVFSGSLQEERDVTNGSSGHKAATRATSLSGYETSFKVWAYKNDAVSGDDDYTSNQTVMNAYTVKWQSGSAYTTTTNTDDWEYILTELPTQNIKYWDLSALAYRFMAYAPSTASVSVGSVAGASSTESLSFTFGMDATSTETIAATPYYSELWFSTGNLALYPDRQFLHPVQLRFVKPYVRVRFLFTQSTEDVEFELTDIAFGPTSGKIARKGSFTVSYPLLGTATRETFSTSDIDDAASYTSLNHRFTTLDPFWYTLMPAASQSSYVMTVTINGKTPARTAAVPAEFMSWKPGFQYTYVFKITDEGGVEFEAVNAAYIPWTVMEKEWEVYNW